MSSDPVNLSNTHRQVLKDAANNIATSLHARLAPLADSTRLLNIYECLTAVVYLSSSPSTLKYLSKEKRLQSFVEGNWDSLGKSQTKEEMVDSGFFYLKEDDHVKCFFCDLGLKDWDQGDIPEREHAICSPLCFFLKSSRGLEHLRSMCERPPNYPTSYTRQDHNQLLKILCEEFNSQHVQNVCQVGFNDTKVFLCVSRLFIRFRQKYTQQVLLLEMQKEWDREMAGDDEQFEKRFDLPAVAQKLYSHISDGVRTPQLSPSSPLATPDNLRRCNCCRRCHLCAAKIVCLPCGHLSLCLECSRITWNCPALNCGQPVESYHQACESGGLTDTTLPSTPLLDQKSIGVTSDPVVGI